MYIRSKRVVGGDACESGILDIFEAWHGLHPPVDADKYDKIPIQLVTDTFGRRDTGDDSGISQAEG